MDYPPPRSSKWTKKAKKPESSTSSTESEHELQKKLKDFYSIDITPPSSPPDHQKIPENRLEATVPSPPRKSSRRPEPSRAGSQDSTTSSTSSTISNKTAPYDGLLMQDASLPDDPEWTVRHAAARRRIKRFIFERFDEVDWRSCPTLEETSFEHKMLWYRRDLRCIASPHYLHELNNGWHRPSYDESPSPNEIQGLLSETDMVDMIG